MAKDPKAKLIMDHYGIDLSPINYDKAVEVDLTAVDVIEGAKKTVENHGQYKTYNLRDDQGYIYKLVEYDGDFLANDYLVQNMKSFEDLSVNDWQVVAPKKPLAGYTLFKMIPPMVQGVLEY